LGRKIKILLVLCLVIFFILSGCTSKSTASALVEKEGKDESYIREIQVEKQKQRVRTPVVRAKTEAEIQTERKIPIVEETEERGAVEEIRIRCFQSSIESIFNDLEALGYISDSSSPAAGLLEEAKRSIKEGYYLEGSNKLLEAVDLDPNNQEIYFWLGNISSIIDGDYLLAVVSLDFAIENDQSSEQTIAMFTYRQRGICNLLMTLSESAIADFTECLSLGSDKEEIIPFFFEGVYANRGAVYQYQWQFMEALEDYDKSFELSESYDIIIEEIEKLTQEMEKTLKQLANNE